MAFEEEEEVLRRVRRPSNQATNAGPRSNGPVTQSSRRLTAGQSERADGESGEQAGRRRAGEKGTLNAAEKGRKPASPTALMIGLGAGILALVLIGVLASSGGGKNEEAVKKPVEAAKDVGEGTPCAELVKLAEQSLANGDKSAAVRYYSRAANRAEQDGNSQQALLYNMKVKDLMLTSRLRDR